MHKPRCGLCTQDGVKDAQFWDTDEPFHYVRLEEHPEAGPVLLVGGENHKTGIKPDEYEASLPCADMASIRCMHAACLLEGAGSHGHSAAVPLQASLAGRGGVSCTANGFL